MSNLETRTVAPIVSATSKRLGVELPEPVAEAIATGQRLRDAEREGYLEAPDLGASVAAAILAGKNPLASKDVQHSILAEQVRSRIGDRLSHHGHQLAADAILEHADAVIDSWRPTVEQADEALSAFREAAPGADLFDDTLATSLPAHALTPWGRAREAVSLLDQLGKGWTAIATAGSIYMPHGARPLIVADVPLEQLLTLGRNPQCSDVARIDVPLSLANTATFTERVARLARERAEHQEYVANAPERAREERRKLVAMRIPAGY